MVRVDVVRSFLVCSCLGVTILSVSAETAPRTDIGREMRSVEDDLIRPRAPRTPSDKARDVLQQTPPPATDDSLVALPGTVRRVEFRGDDDWMETVIAVRDLRNALVGHEADPIRIRTELAKLQQALLDEGYYLAALSVHEVNEETGTVIIDVDAGRVGVMQFLFADRDDGRHFRARQLRRQMMHTQTGDVFNYHDFYRDVYAINVHPSMTMDADLKVESREDDDIPRRIVHMDFAVDEKWPVHAVLSINNYGTDATDNWQFGLTLQHLNLTKRDDVLTFSIPVAVDLDSMRSLAGSYSLPYYARKGGRLTTYGGYSRLDVREVVEDIDIRGEGWFAGLQWSHHLVNSRAHLLSASAGVVHRYVEDRLIIIDIPLDKREAHVRPYSVGLSYTQIQPDRLGGRNIAALQASYNVGDFLGTSDDDEIRNLRPAADADYLIGRLQLARIQPLTRAVNPWVLFARGDGQVADGALIPAEQIAVGGARTVRGYAERELFGDHGAFGNLELRTPLLTGFFSHMFGGGGTEEARAPWGRIQGVLFADGGYVRVSDPLPGEDKDDSIYSAGAGVRVALSRYAQLRADWGFPLKTTDESSSSGAGSIEIQIQY